MSMREDYFKSPHPRNFDYFNFTNEKIHPDGQQLFQHHLFNNFSRDPKSPFSFVQPALESPFPFTTPRPGIGQKIQPGDKIASLVSFTPVSEKCDKNVFRSMPKVINQRIDFNESEDQELIETPCKVSADHGHEGHQTTATKKYDLRFTGSAASRKTTRENQRGLRVLSKLAYQIVLQSGPTTYKEVADKLISEQNEDQKMDDKERQNIKRRVYDALNVLIALGELDKKGRKIIKSKRREKMEEQENKLIQNKSKLLAKLKKRKDAVLEKKEEKQRLLKLHKSLKKLINKNVQGQQREENPEGSKIFFPFVFCQKTNINIQGFPNSCVLSSVESEPMIIRGDSDVLGYLALSQK